MRIRSITPGFWTSEDIAQHDWHDRLLFVGLWSYVDDNGVGRDVERLIAADLFPLDMDPRESLARVSRGLQELARGGQIERYSVDGKDFLHIKAWSKYQRIDRPNKARYPLPTCGNANPRETLASVSRVSSEGPLHGEGEKGRRGVEDKSVMSAVADAPIRPEVEALCELLADRIEGNGCKRPTITKRWRDAARLMLDTDGRTVESVTGAIEWAQADEFWRGNVLSMPKLREKFDAMRLQASRRKSTPADRRQSGADLLAQYEAAAADEIAGEIEQ